MAELKGYEQLQARLRAVSGTNLGNGLMRQLGTAAVREQKILVRRKTGTTARTIHVSDVSANSVTTAAAAAAVFSLGTKAHIIRPRQAKVLAWAAGANRRLSGATRKGAKPDHFAKVVHHPGTKPWPFMEPGARKALEGIGVASIVVKAWNDAA